MYWLGIEVVVQHAGLLGTEGTHHLVFHHEGQSKP
jgi:hypothetical protein